MNNPGSDTQTISTQPPEIIQPYLNQGLAGAQQAFEMGPQQYYPGQTVVPFSGQTEQALGMQEQRAMGGSPVVGAAQDQIQQTLQGDFLNSNPHLDQTFNRGADQIGNRLDSLFARSGRNLDAQAPVLGEQLGDFANSLYGGNYQAERGRQMGAASQAIPLANQDYFDISMLGNVGSQVEGQASNIMQDNVARYNFAQQAPGQSVDDYLRRIMGGSPGSSQTTTSPVYSNNGAGAAGIAALLAGIFGGG